MAGQQQRLGDGETWSLSFQGRQRNFVSPGFCSPGVLLDPKQSKLLSSVFPISNCFTLWLAALHPQESCIHPTTPRDSSRLKSWETWAHSHDSKSSKFHFHPLFPQSFDTSWHTLFSALWMQLEYLKDPAEMHHLLQKKKQKQKHIQQIPVIWTLPLRKSRRHL